MGHLIPSPSDPKYILRFTLLDGGDVLEYEYESAFDAKNDMDVVFSGSPSGLWFNNTFYPASRIKQVEILPPEELAIEQREAAEAAKGKKLKLKEVVDQLEQREED